MNDMLAATKTAALTSLQHGQLTLADDYFRRLFQFNTPTAAQTNALALCGLARIALLRGDRKLAAAYACEALRHHAAAVDAILILGELSDGPAAAAWAHEATTFGHVTPLLADAWHPVPAPTRARRFTAAAHRQLRRLFQTLHR
jgi:hypothetical protein